HGVLADEHHAVVESFGQIVIRGRGASLDQPRARVNLVDGERAAGVVTVPNYYFTGSGFERARHGGIDLAAQQPACFFVTALAGKQLLLGIVDATYALHVGNDENLGPLGGANTERQPENDETVYGTLHESHSCFGITILFARGGHGSSAAADISR